MLVSCFVVRATATVTEATFADYRTLSSRLLLLKKNERV